METEGRKITVDLETGGNKHRIYFKASGTNLLLTPESILAATLLPAMKLEEPLITPKEADPQLLSSVEKIQEIFHAWDNSFHRIPVKATSKTQKIDSQGGVGTFFTGGVDSFYTFLKNKDEITHLIYVHGYENHVITSEIQNIAEKFDKEVIEIETNLREFSDPIVDWHYYIGPGLNAVAHLLKKHLNKVYIPATHTYLDLIPWGTHPLVDPLWSTSNLVISHDGCEATRIDKVALIAKYETALNSLRVCWKQVENKDNCGECEKCIRTMLNLKAMDVLGQSETFPATLSLRKVTRIAADSESKRAWIYENIKHLKKREGNRQFVWALHWVLKKPKFLTTLRRNLLKIRSLILGRV